MPTYEYKCLNCRRKIEIFQSMKDEPKKQTNCQQSTCQKSQFHVFKNQIGRAHV